MTIIIGNAFKYNNVNITNEDITNATNHVARLGLSKRLRFTLKGVTVTPRSFKDLYECFRVARIILNKYLYCANIDGVRRFDIEGDDTTIGHVSVYHDQVDIYTQTKSPTEEDQWKCIFRKNGQEIVTADRDNWETIVRKGVDMYENESDDE
jgi:hypothetical protein